MTEEKGIEEMSAIIEEYIYNKTGNKIQIITNTTVRLLPRPMAVKFMQRELKLMNIAYNIAIEWYRQQEKEN